MQLAAILAKYDLEKKTSIVVLLAVIAVWAGLSAYQELSFPYEDCKSFGKRADAGIGICTDYGQRLYLMYQYEQHRGDQPLRIVTLELLYLSDKLFGDYRIVPFISSGFVLALTYFLAVRLAEKNYAGLIAVLFVLHSPIFYKYDLIMTYPNFWVALFLGSLYYSLTKWPLSPVLFIASLPSKILNLLNFPALLVFVSIMRPPHWKQTVITVSALMGTTIAGIFLAALLYRPFWYEIYSVFLSQFRFQPVEFLWWLGMWSIELFTDKITLFMIFLLLPALFLLKRSGNRNATAVMILLLIFILQPAFISGFTNYTNEDYRYLHLVVFVGIGLSMLFPNLRQLGTQFLKMSEGRAKNQNS